MSITRKLLKGMGLTEEQVETIIEMHTETVNGLKESFKADLEAAQKANKPAEAPDVKETQEYKDLAQQLADKEKEYGTLQAQLADRDYTDAVRSAIAAANGGKGVKFRSKLAEKAFLDDLKANPLKMEDGGLTGFDDYLKKQMDADPYAFQIGNPPPIITKHIGPGGAPAVESKGAMFARQFNAQYAPTQKE